MDINKPTRNVVVAGTYEVSVLSPFMCYFYITAHTNSNHYYSWKDHIFCMISGLNNNKESHLYTNKTSSQLTYLSGTQ